jgi:hypothetical protein
LRIEGIFTSPFTFTRPVSIAFIGFVAWRIITMLKSSGVIVNATSASSTPPIRASVASGVTRTDHAPPPGPVSVRPSVNDPFTADRSATSDRNTT